MDKKWDKHTQAVKRTWHKRFSLIVFFFVLYLMVLHPFVIGPQGYVDITKTKQNVFLLFLICTVFALGLLYAIAIISGYRHGFRGILKNLRVYDYVLIGYLLIAFISACLSEHQTQAWGGATDRNEGFFMLLAYVSVFFVISRLYKPKTRDMLIFAAAGGLIALYGILQFYGIDPFRLNPMEGIHYNVIFFATMSNRNVFSAYLCLILWTSAVLFIRQKEVIFWRYEFLACALIVFYMMLCGITRSGYVGASVALLLMFPFLFKDFKTGSRLFALLCGCSLLVWLFQFTYSGFIAQDRSLAANAFSLPLWSAIACAAISFVLYSIKKPFPLKPAIWRMVWAGVLVVILAAGYIALPVVAEKTQQVTLLEASRLQRGEIDDDMGSARIFIWTRALRLITTTGTGAIPVIPKPPKVTIVDDETVIVSGRFSASASKVTVDASSEETGPPVARNVLLGHGPDNFAVVFAERFGVEAALKHRVLYDKAHNEYLQILVDIGVLGLGSLMVFYVLLLWSARKLTDHPLIVAAVAAIVCYLIQAFFNFAQPFSTPIMWMMLGILGALLREQQSEATVEQVGNTT